MFASAILPLLLAASAAATPISALNQTSPGISWGPCNQTQVNTTGTAPTVCGDLAVPLDYTDSASNATVDLQLVKIPASVTPCKGSIQFNFGGPGDPTRQALATFGYTLLNLTGGQYDLVGFDPRGTGNTLPASCVSNDLEAQALLQQISQIGNASDTALGAIWANTEIVASTCHQHENKTGAFIGTAFVARDLISVVDALDEDGLLRYWGYSYGTTLGATVASMFPERIDKIIIDGVQNPHEYYHAFADFEEWTQTDYVLSSLFTTCVEAGPAACPLVSLNKTGAELETMYLDFLSDLKLHPLAVDGSLLVDYSAVKSYITTLLYDNTSWKAFTDILLAIFTSTSKEAALGQLFQGLSGTSTNESLVGQLTTLGPLYSIHCGDRFMRTDDFSTMVDVYHELNNISKAFGEVLIVREMVCAQWQVEAKERYAGDFSAKLPNTPMLLIGNTGDAYTPVKSAYNVSAGFEGSVVLETDGFGHCSFNTPSSCVLEHTSNYWSHGILPENATKCIVEAKPYRNVTWENVIAQAKNNSTTHKL